MKRRFPVLVLSVALAAGCRTGTPTASPSKKPVHPGTELATSAPAVPATRQVAQSGTVVTLTGKVKLVANNGGAIIGNNGGSVISNNGGAIISDNGGGVVANHGAGRQLLTGGPARELRLADALVALYDARGSQLVDGDGKPLTATTDRQGGYTLKAVLPPGNLVLRVKLAEAGVLKGGELSAILPAGEEPARTQEIDTASSLGASYVLGKYVNGDQAVYDRLPPDQARRLQTELGVARALLDAPPDYHPAALVAATEGLRAKARPLDAALTQIHDLLLGLANLGAGRPATQVPLSDPGPLAFMADGSLLVGEAEVGRIRKVAKDGTLTTLLDYGYGQIKRNFVQMGSLQVGSGDALTLVSRRQVFRIAPDGKVEHLAGTGGDGGAPEGAIAAQAGIALESAATDGAGNLWLVEKENGDQLELVGPDGLLRHVGPALGLPAGAYGLVAAGPDGRCCLLVLQAGNPLPSLYRFKAGGKAELQASNVPVEAGAFPLPAADGTVYFAWPNGHQVVAVAPDGTARTLAGEGGPEATRGLVAPRGLALAPDGTLYVADASAGLVYALAPGGGWKVVAGTNEAEQDGANGALAINSPFGLVFDAQGRLVVAESGSSRLQAFDGKRLVTVAGSTRGFSGDGGPATAAQLSDPYSLVRHGDELIFIDRGNECIRKVAADGTITTVAGRALTPLNPQQAPLAAGVQADAATFSLKGAMDLVQGADGSLYWSDLVHHQILRLTPDARHIELVAGAPGELNPVLTFSQFVEGQPATQARLGVPVGLALDARGDLYYSDLVHYCVRKIADPAHPGGPITTVAGAGIGTALQRATANAPHADEEGIRAKDAVLITPLSLAFDPAGNLYVAEGGSVNLGRFRDFQGGIDFSDVKLPADYARIRKIAPDGTITSLVGVDGLYATDPTGPDALVLPSKLLVAPDGRLVFADVGANQIRFLPAGSY